MRRISCQLIISVVISRYSGFCLSRVYTEVFVVQVSLFVRRFIQLGTASCFFFFF